MMKIFCSWEKKCLVNIQIQICYMYFYFKTAYPEYDGGAAVSEFAVQMVTPDNACREVYKGRDLDCIVAGLSPGRPYLFQVRAFNRVGVC